MILWLEPKGQHTVSPQQVVILLWTKWSPFPTALASGRSFTAGVYSTSAQLKVHHMKKTIPPAQRNNSRVAQIKVANLFCEKMKLLVNRVWKRNKITECVGGIHPSCLLVYDTKLDRNLGRYIAKGVYSISQLNHLYQGSMLAVHSS